MKHIALLLSLFLTLALNARENPFQPIKEFTSEPLTKPIPIADFEDRFEHKIVSVIEKKAECKTVIDTKEAQDIDKEEDVWKRVQTPPQKPKIKQQRKSVKKFKKNRFTRIYEDQNLKIYTKSKHIKIVTKEKIQKHFTLRSPNRLVIDFKDDFFIYDSLKKRINSRYVKEIRLGTHDCFFRLTFVLTSRFSYKLIKASNGYLIKLQ